MARDRLTGLLLWLLFNIFNVLFLLTGASGKESFIYSSVGDTANLSCNHAGHLNCSSIAWIFSHTESSSADELVTHGKIKDANLEKSGKLRVEPNCSLHINNLTISDTGRYDCRLYLNEKQHTDAPIIHLSLLTVFKGSPVTELKIGSVLTLHCQLHSDKPCTRSNVLTWVTETGALLQGDRYTVSPSQCSSSLSVTLDHSDNNRKWICQLIVKGKRELKHSYTTIFPDENSISRFPLEWLYVCICVPVILIVILIFKCKQRTGQRQMEFDCASQSQAVTEQSQEQHEDTITYAAVNISVNGRKPDRKMEETETEYAAIKTNTKNLNT